MYHLAFAFSMLQNYYEEPYILLHLMYNELKRYPEDDWKVIPAYEQLALTHAKASECLGCRSCEEHCPQRIAISEEMRRVAEIME